MLVAAVVKRSVFVDVWTSVMSMQVVVLGQFWFLSVGPLGVHGEFRREELAVESEKRLRLGIRSL